MTSDPSSIAPLLQKLSSVFQLGDAERRALLEFPMHVREMAAGQDVVRQGDRPTHCCVVLRGFGFRHKVVGDGRRQILSIHIPGEMPDLMGLHLPVMDHTLSALSPATVGLIPHQQIHRLVQDHPRIAQALWRESLIDAAIFREWMTSIGRRDARGRVAHLFCELVTRLEAVGLASGKRIDFPITQTVIADSVGLSTVHVNRVVQELRAEGLITLGNGELFVRNWRGLLQAAEFDPTYLHLIEK